MGKFPGSGGPFGRRAKRSINSSVPVPSICRTRSLTRVSCLGMMMVVGWRRRKDKGKTRRGTRVPCRMAILLLTARAVELWSTFYFPFHFFVSFFCSDVVYIVRGTVLLCSPSPLFSLCPYLFPPCRPRASSFICCLLANFSSITPRL